jgi:hypothetical protein
VGIAQLMSHFCSMPLKCVSSDMVWLSPRLNFQAVSPLMFLGMGVTSGKCNILCVLTPGCWT